jgi:hypothetical protein
MATREEQETRKLVSDLAGVFTDPIICYPGGWGNDTPSWLRKAIVIERMVEERKPTGYNGTPTGTDAEACAYLSSASMDGPMDSDWADIYLYVATRTYERYKNMPMSADIAVREISSYRQHELDRLKRWIYERRIRDRQERERTERREAKTKKVEQGIESLPLFAWKES